MKPSRRLLCITATLLMSFESAQACTCMAPASPAEAFEKASAAFTGRVTKIYQSLWDAAGITRTGNHRVKFEVTKRWKGPQARSIVVVTRLTGEACGFPFEGTKEYLVYVAPGPPISRQESVRGQKALLALKRKWSSLIGW
jgi:hypothetical protein